MDVKVKQAKAMTILLFSMYIVTLLLALVTIGFLINDIVEFYNANNAYEEHSIWILGIGSLGLAVFGVCSMISAVRATKEIYVFTDDKIVKTYKQKVKLEIEYSTIVRITINGLMFDVYYKKSVDGCSGAKNLKSFHGCFSKKDIEQIKEKIIAFNAENGGNILLA